MELESKPSTLSKVLEVIVSFIIIVWGGAILGAALWGILSFAVWEFNLASVYPFIRGGMIVGFFIWVLFLCDTKKGLTSTW